MTNLTRKEAITVTAGTLAATALAGVSDALATTVIPAPDLPARHSAAPTPAAAPGDPAPANPNPHAAAFVNDDMARSIDSLRRMDDRGHLYAMDYVADYYDPALLDILKQLKHYDAGCSAFFTHTMDGAPLMCRNYDYKHFDSDGNVSALDVVIRCKPQGKYASIGIADCFWLELTGTPFPAGVLDDGVTDISAMAIAPFIMMDGINEKGLCCSILKLRVKEGETCVNQTVEGRTTVTHNVLVRYLLDNCATVQEAIDLAGTFNLRSSMDDADFHIFLTDAQGDSAVVEWRYNELFATRTDAVTNFLVGFDDAEDYYRDGELRENFVCLQNTVRDYRYGFGQGYHRFTGIVSGLERFIDRTLPGAPTFMDEPQALDILRAASQDLGVEETSMTLHSVIYNSRDLTMSAWIMRDFDRRYDFAL